jgi:hypothetical protein
VLVVGSKSGGVVAQKAATQAQAKEAPAKERNRNQERIRERRMGTRIRLRLDGHLSSRSPRPH